MPKPIENYEMYKIDEIGNIYRNNMKLKQSIRNNYKCVDLCKNGEIKRYSTHRLVAETYIPNINNLPQINHKDGNRFNNSIENLEWCTSSYNIKHAFRVLGRKPSDGNQSKKVICIETNKVYNSMIDAKRQTGINNHSISKVCTGKREKAGDFHWAFYKNN